MVLKYLYVLRAESQFLLALSALFLSKKVLAVLNEYLHFESCFMEDKKIIKLAQQRKEILVFYRCCCVDEVMYMKYR